MASLVEHSDELIYEEEEDFPVERQVRVAGLKNDQDSDEMEEGEISGPEESVSEVRGIPEIGNDPPNFRPPLFSKSARMGLQVTIGNTKHLPVIFQQHAVARISY